MTILSGAVRARQRLAAKRRGRKRQEFVGAQALAVVAEGLACVAVLLEMLKERHQRRHDVVLVHKVLEHEVQPVTENVAAYEDRELVAAAADQADVALIRPRAAVRATGHAHTQLFLFQTKAL